MISVLKDLDFAAVARQLRINITRQALPTRAACPLCKRGRMKFYRDMVSGGPVFHCGGCGEEGDVIDLMAKVWKIDAMAVCYKLRDLGLVSLGSFEVHDLLDQRARYKRGLEKGQRALAACMQPGLLEDDRLPVTLERLRLRLECRFSGAREYCPQIFGCASPEELHAAIGGQKRARTSKNSQLKSHQHGIAVPFYDLPGRVTAISLLDKTIGSRKISENRLLIGYGKYREEGVAGHPDVLFEAGGSLILTPHTMLAVRMWARGALQHYHSLPLVVAKEGTQCWQMFGGKQRIVFAYGSEDLEALRLAAQLDAQVIVFRKSGKPEDTIPKMHIATFHKRSMEKKRPWSSVVASILSKKGSEDGLTYLEKLKLSPDELAQLRDIDKYDSKRIVENFLRGADGCRTTPYRCGVIEQTAAGWRYKTKDRVDSVCNAQIRIDEISRYGEQKIASVSVTQEEKRVDFQVDYDELTDNFYRVVHDECLSGGAVVIAPRHWHSQLQTISLQLHTPKLSQGIGYVGYDPQQKIWITPSHVIRQGRITRKAAIPDWISLPGNMRPDWRHWKKFISRTSPVVVAGVIAAVEQMLSGPRREIRRPVVLSGSSAMVAARAIRDATAATDDRQFDHGWLVIPKDISQGTRSNTAKKLEASFHQGSWVLTNDVQRCYGMFSGGMSLVDYGDPTFIEPGDLGSISAAFLYLLKHWRGEPDTLAYALTQFEEAGISLDRTKIEKCLSLNVDSCLAFVTLLKEIHNRGKAIHGEEATKRSKSGVIRPYKNGVDTFVPARIIETAMRRLNLGEFENFRIMQQLSRSKHYRRFVPMGGESGWLLDKAFVDKVFADESIQIKNFTLRLVS